MRAPGSIACSAGIRPNRLGAEPLGSPLSSGPVSSSVRVTRRGGWVRGGFAHCSHSKRRRSPAWSSDCGDEADSIEVCRGGRSRGELINLGAREGPVAQQTTSHGDDDGRGDQPGHADRVTVDGRSPQTSAGSGISSWILSSRSLGGGGGAGESASRRSISCGLSWFIGFPLEAPRPAGRTLSSIVCEWLRV